MEQKMSKRTKGKSKLADTTNFALVQISALVNDAVVTASNEAYSGMELLRSEGERMINVLVDKKQGNLFEIIERTKFNMDAALKKSSIRAVTTAEQGKPLDLADIHIVNQGDVVQKVQAKSSSEPARALNLMSNRKYRTMQKLFNVDKVDRARELAEKRVNTGTLKTPEYIDTLENMTGKLKHKNISSSGTSYAEAMKAATDYRKYSFDFELEQFKDEFKKSFKSSVINSSIIGGGVSILKNGIAFSKNEIDKDELVGNILIDTSLAAFKGGSTGGASTVVRTIAQKSGNLIIGKTSVATSIAVGVINSGITVVDYVKGDISAEQAMIQIGEKGFTTMSSIYAGLAAGVVFGPGGAVIGSLVGYMVATNVYFTCIDTFNHSALRVEEASRLINLYDESIKIRSQERVCFESYIKARLAKNDTKFSDVIAIIDRGISSSDFRLSIRGMEQLANYLGEELKYARFEDFDLLMKSDDILVI